MEAATVARRPAASAAPATAPRPATPKRRPRGRPVPGRRTNPTKRAAPAKRAVPAKRGAPAKRAPAKRAPTKRAQAQRSRAGSAAPARRPAPARLPVARPHLIPIAVGTAALVKELPDSSLIVRLTRGRAWIGVLGVLLAGIVALNVFTLGLAADAGQIDQNVVALEKENSFLRSLDAKLSGSGRVRSEAGAAGLAMADVDEVTSIQAGEDDLAVAVQRLAAAGGGY